MQSSMARLGGPPGKKFFHLHSHVFETRECAPYKSARPGSDRLKSPLIIRKSNKFATFGTSARPASFRATLALPCLLLYPPTPHLQLPTCPRAPLVGPPFKPH